MYVIPSDSKWWRDQPAPNIQWGFGLQRRHQHFGMAQVRFVALRRGLGKRDPWGHEYGFARKRNSLFVLNRRERFDNDGFLRISISMCFNFTYWMTLPAVARHMCHHHTTQRRGYQWEATRREAQRRSRQCLAQRSDQWMSAKNLGLNYAYCKPSIVPRNTSNRRMRLNQRSNWYRAAKWKPCSPFFFIS